MKKEEILVSFKEWLSLSLDDKYKDAQKDYFKEHPNDATSDFHLNEIEFWENRLKDPNKYPMNQENYDHWDIKFVVQIKKLLAYYQKLEHNATNTTKNEHLVTHITTFDRVIRELQIIYTVFKAQFLKYDETDPLPLILNSEGHSGNDGRYICWIDILSDVELLSLQVCKQEFTERYEKTNNLSLLQNQLLEIRTKAIEVRDYYDSKLTKKCKIVREFIKKSRELDRIRDVEKKRAFLDSHSAVITVNNYFLSQIYLGIQRDLADKFLSRKEYIFSYVSNNHDLALRCQSIIEFIDKFNLDGRDNGNLENSVPINISGMENKFDAVNMKEVYEHFKMGLVEKKYLSETDLHKYLNAAFVKKSPPRNRFKLKDVQVKRKIIRVFADYYKNNAGKPHGEQSKYAALLGDYFIGYNTKNVSSNFSK